MKTHAPKAPRAFLFDAATRRKYPMARAFLAPQARVEPTPVVELGPGASKRARAILKRRKRAARAA